MPLKQHRKISFCVCTLTNLLPLLVMKMKMTCCFTENKKKWDLFFIWGAQMFTMFLILSTRSRSKLQCVFLTTSQSSQPWLYVVKIKDLAKNSFLTHPSVWENFDPLDKHDESCLQHSLVGFGQEFFFNCVYFLTLLAWQIVNMHVCKFVRMIDWLTQINTYTHIRTIVHAISTSIRSTKT